MLTHPLISPLYGDLKGLPPVLIQVGDGELLSDEGLVMFYKLACQNCEIQTGTLSENNLDTDITNTNSNTNFNAMDGNNVYRIEQYTDMPHVFQYFIWAPQTKTSYLNVGHWMDYIFNDIPTTSGNTNNKSNTATVPTNNTTHSGTIQFEKGLYTGKICIRDRIIQEHEGVGQVTYTRNH
jgi:hypothetical protein